MSKIKILNYDFLKEAKEVKPKYNENYKRLQEEADKRIEIDKLNQKKAFIASQFYYALSSESKFCDEKQNQLTKTK